MDDHAYHHAIRRIRRFHYLHYPAQGALMATLVLAAGRRTASGTAVNPQLATWPLLFMAVGLLMLVGGLIYLISAYIRPNLRRPPAENLRLYQSRIFLRNSLLGLACLPPLAAHVLSGEWWNLLFFGCLLLVPCLVAAPSARSYQKWLIS